MTFFSRNRLEPNGQRPPVMEHWESRTLYCAELPTAVLDEQSSKVDYVVGREFESLFSETAVGCLIRTNQAERRI